MILHPYESVDKISNTNFTMKLGLYSISSNDRSSKAIIKENYFINPRLIIGGSMKETQKL